LKSFGICGDPQNEKTVLCILDCMLEIFKHYLNERGIEFADESKTKTKIRLKTRQTRTKLPLERNHVYRQEGQSRVEAFLRTIFADLDSDSERITASLYTTFGTLSLVGRVIGIELFMP
jgi:hypothetical protein